MTSTELPVKVIAIDGPSGAGKSSVAKLIARKLGIHSVAGLTIYAIVNKLVDVGDIEQGGGEARRSGAGNGK